LQEGPPTPPPRNLLTKISKENPTSYSDVMSLRSGERTFFHARGANAEFSPVDIDIDALDCKISIC
jgi:sugar/nucleoside kinase (ribokinase family)